MHWTYDIYYIVTGLVLGNGILTKNLPGIVFMEFWTCEFSKLWLLCWSRRKNFKLKMLPMVDAVRRVMGWVRAMILLVDAGDRHRKWMDRMLNIVFICSKISFPTRLLLCGKYWKQVLFVCWSSLVGLWWQWCVPLDHKNPHHLLSLELAGFGMELLTDLPEYHVCNSGKSPRGGRLSLLGIKAAHFPALWMAVYKLCLKQVSIGCLSCVISVLAFLPEKSSGWFVTWKFGSSSISRLICPPYKMSLVLSLFAFIFAI